MTTAVRACDRAGSREHRTQKLTFVAVTRVFRIRATPQGRSPSKLSWPASALAGFQLWLGRVDHDEARVAKLFPELRDLARGIELAESTNSVSIVNQETTMMDIQRPTAVLARRPGALRQTIVPLMLIAMIAIATRGAAQVSSESRTGGPKEGIKVIGEWTIVIRDEAGREVQRSQFHNALEDQGKPTLASLLSRQRAISEWLILLTNASGAQPCGAANADHSCGMVEHLSSQLPFTSSVDYAPALTVDTDPTDATKMRLRGTTKATRDSFITTVNTMLSLCPAGPPSPTGCASTQDFRYFSGTVNFTNPPQVRSGQTIDVTVLFSFQ